MPEHQRTWTVAQPMTSDPSAAPVWHCRLGRLPESTWSSVLIGIREEAEEAAQKEAEQCLEINVSCFHCHLKPLAHLAFVLGVV